MAGTTDGKRPPSIRRRLFLLLIGFTALAWVASAALSYRDAHHEIDELFDAQLAQAAKVLMARAAHNIGKDENDGDEAELAPQFGLHKYEQKVAYQIWDARGRLIARSANSPATRLSEKTQGFDDARLEGVDWRIISLEDLEHHLVVQVGERHDIRQELAGHIALRVLMPIMLALPVLGVVIWLAVGSGLAPLRRLRAEVGARAADNLEPMHLADAPVEVQPLVASLNDLLSRLADALEAERRFTADAAHELRTPLAALKTQAQVAQRAQNEPQRSQALSRIVEAADRATHLIEQLLTLARLDHSATDLKFHTIDLRTCVSECLAQIAPQAVQEHIELAFAQGAAAYISGDALLLGILVRNLLDNAVRYTGKGGTIEVETALTDGGATLTVTDNGPGIPQEEREHIFLRFHRGLGNQASGSGLGLSIAQRIAELHGGTISLADAPSGRGLEVTARFPRAP
jgi:two-component system sensor histidine kinase QseC